MADRNHVVDTCLINIKTLIFAYSFILSMLDINRLRATAAFVTCFAVGFLVFRKVRPGIGLLVDQFMLELCAADALGCLPWLTLLFRPKEVTRKFSGTF